MDYEKLYKAYYLQVYSYTISLAKNREDSRGNHAEHILIRLFLQHHNSKVSQMN